MLTAPANRVIIGAYQRRHDMPKGYNIKQAAQWMAGFRAGKIAAQFNYDASREWSTAYRYGYSDGIASNKGKVY